MKCIKITVWMKVSSESYFEFEFVSGTDLSFRHDCIGYISSSRGSSIQTVINLCSYTDDFTPQHLQTGLWIDPIPQLHPHSAVLDVLKSRKTRLLDHERGRYSGVKRS
jgi:hypothetical protein